MQPIEFNQRVAVVAGVSRGGTTFLYHNLQLHPEIYLPARKETAYFAYNYEKGLDWFQRFYSGMKSEKIALDICGVYFMDPEAISRMRAFNPEMKVILGIRQPLDWVYSMYGHYASHFDIPPFREFLQGCTIHREGEHYRLEFAGGKIERTVKDYAAAFGDNLLVYDFGMLEDNALSLLRRIETFLGIAPYYNEENFTNAKINVRGTGGNRNILMYSVNRIPGLATFISKAVPKDLIMKMRRRIEVSKPKETKPPETADARLTEEDREHARQVLEQDTRFVADLFKSSPFLTGSAITSETGVHA